MSNKNIALQFTVLTFCIAYGVSGILICLGHFGYSVSNQVSSLQQFAMNIPFALYILSPAIASYIILKRNNEVNGLIMWIKAVFFAKNKLSVYLSVFAGLILYFGTLALASPFLQMALPFYMFFLSLPGNLFIGGLEESGWMYVLQPRLDTKYGFIRASFFIGVIWIFWHIPLFFIPGTSHYEGLIPFWPFNMQVMALSFFRSAIYRIAEKGYVFAYLLFHTMFNAASSLFGSMSWIGITAASAAILLFSCLIVLRNKRIHTN